MDGPCELSASYGVWVFLVVAMLSHARGTVLLLREARSWFFEMRSRRRRTRTPGL